MRISISSPIPDLGSIPGPSRPGWLGGGSYDFQFEVSQGQVAIAVLPKVNGLRFTVKWQNGTEQAITSANLNLQSPTTDAGIISINNEKLDTTWCDDFKIVSGQSLVTKVLSWGQNPWTNLSSAFLNCTNLTDISTTSLITGVGCVLSSAFKSCTSLTDVNISSWDMTNAAVIDEMFRLCTGLEVFQASNLNVNGGSRWWLRETGTAVTNGCEYRFNGLNITATAFGANNMTQWWYGMKINPASSFANISWPSIAHSGANFQNSSITGVNSTLNCSGWTNYNSTVFPYFSSFTATEGGTSNMKIDITNLNVSTVRSFNRTFLASTVSEIVGLGGLGATDGVTNMEYAFHTTRFLKFNNHNLSSNFINSFNLGSGNFTQVFLSNGNSLTLADAGPPPNLHNLDLSSATNSQLIFNNAKYSTAPDFSNVTMPSTAATNLYGWFQGMQVNDNSNLSSLFSKTFKVSSFQQTFYLSNISTIVIGGGIDFSSCTSMHRMFQSATATDVQLPTNMDLGNITATNGFQYMFLSGPTLSACQVDNFIRRLHATALSNGLAIDFEDGPLTESPAVVQSLKDELVSNGWSITTNTTDATIPFEYPNFVEPGVATAPTNNTGSAFTGTFTSSDPTNIPVNSSTGVINTTNTGNATIRYTLSDGCYTEQAILVASPFITSWNIDSDFVNQTFNFRRASTGTTNNNTYFDYQIDWGDGSAMESFTDNTTPSHTYTSAGTYDIKVIGMIPGMSLAYRSGNSFIATPEAEKLLEIKKWGDCKFSSFYYGFGACKNMTVTATDNPTFRQAGVTGYMNNFFRNCNKITSYDFTPWQTMFNNIRPGGLEYLCSGTSKIEYIKIPSFTMGYSNAQNTSLFNAAGVQAGIEILNAGSGLSTGVLTTTDTGNFAIRVNEVDSNGSALDGRISLYNADGWAENAVFNFTGGLQVKITKAKPGCEIIMKDMTLTGEPYFRNLMYKAVVESADLSGWTIDKITSMSGWLSINNANQQDVTVNMDNWTATGDGITSMSTFMGNLNQYDSTVAFIGPKILKTTNWDSSVTENLTNFSRLGNTSRGKYSRLREWWGLDQIKLGKVTTFERMMEFMSFIAFSSENGRNFSSTCMDNRVSTPTSINCSRFFMQMGLNVDYQNETNWQMPNLDGWNFTATNPVSWGSAFNGIAMFKDDNNSPGGIAFDLSNVDLSNISSLSSAFRQVNKYTSAANKPAGAQTIKIDSLSSTLTSMYYTSQESTITNWDLRGSDLSGVTSMERVFGEEISSINNFRFQFDNTVNLSAVTNATGFLNYNSRILNADDYANMLRGFAAGSQTSVRIDVNGTYFNAGLIFTDGRTPEQMTDTTTANKVVDENKNFVELGVSVGDIVESRRANTSPIVLASVTAVSETELTLSDSIIANNDYRFYNIQTSQAAKDRFKLLDTQSWIIYDGGPLIS